MIKELQVDQAHSQQSNDSVEDVGILVTTCGTVTSSRSGRTSEKTITEFGGFSICWPENGYPWIFCSLKDLSFVGKVHMLTVHR